MEFLYRAWSSGCRVRAFEGFGAGAFRIRAEVIRILGVSCNPDRLREVVQGFRS